MSALTFKAVIGGVHFDPKKGIAKIQLEATSYVSLDALTTLQPQDESIRVTLESEQTTIEDFALVHEEAAKNLAKFVATGIEPATTDISIGEEGGEWLKKAADKLREPGEVVDETAEPLDEDPDAAGEDIEE